MAGPSARQKQRFKCETGAVHLVPVALNSSVCGVIFSRAFLKLSCSSAHTAGRSGDRPQRWTGLGFHEREFWKCSSENRRNDATSKHNALYLVSVTLQVLVRVFRTEGPTVCLAWTEGPGQQSRRSQEGQRFGSLKNGQAAGPLTLD